jgi:riboflavin kinase/FMN adenylyltransferase
VLILFGLERVPAGLSSVVCIGAFDGVHLGHASVIRQTVDLARQQDCSACVLTFDRNPLETLAPERAPLSVAPLASDLEQFRLLGVDLTVVLPFTRELSQVTAQDFFDHVLIDALGAQIVVVGHDFGFGRGREGNGKWLEERIDTKVVGPLLLDGERISSSAIRQAIAEGHVEYADRLLGRPFALSGTVVKGQQIGQAIGYPTANLAVEQRQVIPADGVYSGIATVDGTQFLAAIGIGMRPTVGGTHRTIEAHLLDFGGRSIYGRHLELAFRSRLRSEVHFHSVEELAEQMAKDVEQVRAENADGSEHVMKSRVRS